MKTYVQIQRKAEQSRTIERRRIQKGEQSGVRQFQTNDVNAVLQGAFKVKEKKIVEDAVNEDLRNRVFEKPNSASMNRIAGAKTLEEQLQIVRDHRDEFAFNKLNPSKAMNNSDDVSAWLGQNPEMEHIYLYKNSTIYGGISGFEKKTNKNPHPTILGGDPEVDFAGIIYGRKSDIGGKTNTIIINNDSGHYPVVYERECGGALNKLGTIMSHHKVISVKARP